MDRHHQFQDQGHLSYQPQLQRYQHEGDPYQYQHPVQPNPQDVTEHQPHPSLSSSTYSSPPSSTMNPQQFAPPSNHSQSQSQSQSHSHSQSGSFSSSSRQAINPASGYYRSGRPSIGSRPVAEMGMGMGQGQGMADRTGRAMDVGLEGGTFNRSGRGRDGYGNHQRDTPFVDQGQGRGTQSSPFHRTSPDPHPQFNQASIRTNSQIQPQPPTTENPFINQRAHGPLPDGAYASRVDIDAESGEVLNSSGCDAPSRGGRNQRGGLVVEGGYERTEPRRSLEDQYQGRSPQMRPHNGYPPSQPQSQSDSTLTTPNRSPRTGYDVLGSGSGTTSPVPGYVPNFGYGYTPGGKHPNGDGNGVHPRMPYRAPSSTEPYRVRTSTAEERSIPPPTKPIFTRIDVDESVSSHAPTYTSTDPRTDSNPPINSSTSVSRPRRDRSISQSSNLPRDKLALDELDEEEKAMLKKGMFDWKEVTSWRYWVRREWLWYYVAAVILGVLVTLMTLYHQQIVAWLTPATVWMKNLTCGWLIPIAVMIVLSIPPLFGQEIVCVLCGLIWGLWIGFGIIAAGTFIGELGNFYLFRTLLRGHAIKMERGKMNYALMAHVVRDGGIMMALMVRMSAIPGHFTTAVFSTCGMSVWTFSIACFLTLPKQLVVVYLGVALEDVNATTADKITKYSIIGASVVVTILAAWYIYWKMNKARIVLHRARRAQITAEKGDGMDMDAVPSQHLNDVRTEDSVESLRDMEAGVSILRNEYGGRGVVSDAERGSPYTIRYLRNDNMSIYAVDDSLNGHQGASGDLSAPYDASMGSSTEHLNPTPFPDAQPHYEGQQMVYRGDSNASSVYTNRTEGQDAGHPDRSGAAFPVPAPLQFSADRGKTQPWGQVRAMERISLSDDRRGGRA